MVSYSWALTVMNTWQNINAIITFFIKIWCIPQKGVNIIFYCVAKLYDNFDIIPNDRVNFHLCIQNVSLITVLKPFSYLQKAPVYITYTSASTTTNIFNYEKAFFIILF